jgi:tetratricopeptide (TPR) repeat protein
LPAPTTRRSLRRAQRPRALSDKGLSLYNLDRKDEALNLYDKIARRKAKGPAQRGVAAKALFNKGYLLYELDRKDGALRVCDEMVARFGTAKEPSGLR